MINAVVLIEQSLGLVSFRPKLKLPKVVPLVGALGGIFAMFIINPTVSLIAVVTVLGFYALLIRRHLEAPFADVRSGLFVAVVQWAAQKAADLPTTQERAWKPNLLIPVSDTLELRGTHHFIEDLVWPTGYVELMGMSGQEPRDVLEPALRELAGDFRKEGIYTRWTVLDTDDVAQGLSLGMMVLVLRESHINLAILVAYMVTQNWKGRLNLVSCVEEDRTHDELRAELQRVIDLARLPDPEIHLLDGPFMENLSNGPRADVDIMGLSRPPNFELMREAIEKTRSTCVFVADSGQESAMA